MPFRVGFLGTGAWSRAHLYRVQQVADVAVTCCFGSNPAKTRDFQSAAGDGCRIVPTYTDLFAEADAIYVTIPPFAHDRQIADAIETGVHVFTEKPLARTVEQARVSVSAAQVHPDVRTQLGYMLRFTRTSQVLSDFVFRRGQPILFTGTYFCRDLHAHWWRNHDLSGGQLLEQMIHLVDLSCLLSGEPLQALLAAGNLAHRDVDGYTSPDVTSLIVRFESGALASLSATNCAVPGRWDMQYQIVFEHLTVRVDSDQRARFWVTETDGAESFTVEEPHDPYAAETEDFIASIREGRPARCPIEQGLVALRVIEAAERSRAEGGFVDVAA